MEIILALAGAASLVAAALWLRSARRLRVVWKRVEAESGRHADVTVLARSQFRKDLHTSVLYTSVAVGLAAVAAFDETVGGIAFLILAVPVTLSVLFGRDFVRESRIAEDRSKLERKAEEVLSQEELAPKRWADRLAPEMLPEFAGFELGRRYQAGTGLMAGDFYDVVQVGSNRIAAVIGDVTGRGIDASITAFQAKYLLRVFLRQYRDPAQALEELNAQMSAVSRSDEEFISLFVVVLDTEHHTLRFASAGHPSAWLWHDRDVRPLKATGALVMLERDSEYHSKEIPLEKGDLVLLYTDGLAEVRNGEQMFGEERIANALRRDPNVAADVLCKNLLEAARDFASEPMDDDVAILAIRRA
jgi:sigma-B regulation protein RsbU (phosphoserine phosphatase)